MKILQLFKNNKFRLLLFIFLLGFLFLHFYAPRFITEVRHPLIEKIREIKGVRSFIELITIYKKGELLTFKSKDGLNLKAFVLETNQKSVKGNIILVHGIRGNMHYLSEAITFYSNLGYNTITVDLRAHGLSEGQFCTFGVKEKEDIKQLIDILSVDIRFKDFEFGIWGQSLGGAVSLQALAYDKRLKWGIVESTFSNFNTVVNDYFEDYLGLSVQILSDYLVNRAGCISDFDTELAKPKMACEKITQPILMIHGSDDNKIDIKYGLENFKALKSTEKKFLKIEKASHGNVWRLGGDDLKLEIKSFLSNLNQTKT